MPGQATASCTLVRSACVSFVCVACVTAAPTRLWKLGDAIGLAATCWQQGYKEMQRGASRPTRHIADDGYEAR